jgi:polyisoprenyl-teichoic acid--peptidoglycan teichoic acid transferase
MFLLGLAMRPTMHRLSLVIVTTVVLVVFASSFWHWYYQQWQPSERRLPASITAPEAKTDSVILRRPYTLLFVGNDITYTRSGKRQIPDAGSFKGRCDSLMLLRIDPVAKTISGLQIPRDTMAEIPGYGVNKINAANVLGGPQLSKETASRLTGADIDHYLVLNINGLVNVVNELGGITLNVPKRMSYMDWTGKLKIDLQPGMHTLTGNQAMGFVRFRHDALGDIGRLKRQEIFLHAFADKLIDPKSWPHLPQLMAILHHDVSTDLSDLEAMQTFNLLRCLPRKNIHIVMLPGHFGPSGSWVVDKDAVLPLVMELMYPLAKVRQSAASDSAQEPDSDYN